MRGLSILSRFFGLLLLSGALAVPAARAADLAIVGAKIYPAPRARPIARGTVLIHDGRIAAVGPAGRIRVPRGATIVDGRGAVVTAGFWNSHVHILTHNLLHAETRPAADLSRTLTEMFSRWGFTTVFDLASVEDNTNLIRSRIRRGEVSGPNILTVGEPFYPPHGAPAYIRQFLRDEHLPAPEVTSVPQALERERRQIAAGADGVKLFTGAIVGGDVGVLPMDAGLATALAEQAHRLGRPVFAHPSNAKGVEIALTSGVDILAHAAPMMGDWTPALVARLRARRMALIPTLSLFEVEAKKFGESAADEARDVATAVQQVGLYHAAGGEILFGTDVGYTDLFDTDEEFRLMRRAGLDYRAILASLTATPARRFGYGARKGRVEAGMDADLVLLKGDPAADVIAFACVLTTIRGGAIIFSRTRQAARCLGSAP
ncbi:MAG TPA: amidohydrolase family protein [Allosphingosinicella sp.]|nr:amidohydrolase family protein [Allosphingosinicella sp.]